MSDSVEQRLHTLGLALPPVSKAAGNYLGCKQVHDILYVGGHGPVTANGIRRGSDGGPVRVWDCGVRRGYERSGRDGRRSTRFA